MILRLPRPGGNAAMTASTTAPTAEHLAFIGHRCGLGILPPREDGSKAPLAEYEDEKGRRIWEPYQRSHATPAHIAEWYANGRTGLGIVTGKISGHWNEDGENIDGLEVFEFDDRPTYDAFMMAAEAVGLASLIARIRAGYEESTPGGGVHWPCRCAEISGNTKLAERPKRPNEMGHPNDKRKVLIETRGEGGFIITAPSAGSVHPTGKAYVLVSGGFDTIATISPQEREALWDLARTFDQMPEKPIEPHATARSAAAAGGRPGDDFAARVDWPEILEPHGWRRVYGKLWRRPGKERGWSASVDYQGSNLLYVFSSSTAFEPERGYGKFSAFALLNHGGDFTAAAKVLAAHGFGEQRRNGSTPDSEATAALRAEVDVSEAGTVALTADEKHHLSDHGNSLRLVQRHGNDMRYSSTAGGLFAWDGQRYQRDEDDACVTQFAAATARSIYHEANTEADPERRQALGKHALKSEAAPRLAAMVALAKTHPAVRVRADAFDADRSLLNCPNGTLNTITAELHEHRREDLCTKLAGAPFDHDAGCPMWDAFLFRIMGGNEALIRFLQRAIGYSLTGDASEQVLFLAHGKGANGKSTLLETVRGVLGDYARATPFSTFLSRGDGDRATNDLAALSGARFVSATEADAGKQLSESVTKQVTGGDLVKARYLFREYFEYLPQFKVWLAANVKPTIQGTDEAIWRRVRLIPFDVTIPEAERDRHLAEKLRSELSGILAWAVRGCLQWRKDGLGVPEEVRRATDEYRTEQDTIAGFLDDACVLHPQAQVPSGRLYHEYAGWCANSGEKPVTQKALASLLTERGFVSVRLGKERTRTWQGMGLRSDTDPTDGGRMDQADALGRVKGDPSQDFSHEGEYRKNASICVRQGKASAKAAALSTETHGSGCVGNPASRTDCWDMLGSEPRARRATRSAVARTAGYSERTARVKATVLLTIANIAAAIAVETEKRNAAIKADGIARPSLARVGNPSRSGTVNTSANVGGSVRPRGHAATARPNARFLNFHACGIFIHGASSVTTLGSACNFSARRCHDVVRSFSYRAPCSSRSTACARSRPLGWVCRSFCTWSQADSAMLRLGRLVHLNQRRLHWMEGWVQRHGIRAIVPGRLIPGLRHDALLAGPVSAPIPPSAWG